MISPIFIDLFFILFIFFYLLAIFIGAPFVPSRRSVVKQMVELGGDLTGKRVADLGAGEGRVMIAAAFAGAKEVHGYEINPFLVLVSWWKIYRAGLRGKVFIHWGSYWGQDLSSFDTIFVYGISYIMGRLEKKLNRELKPGTVVVSNAFAFSGWKTVKNKNQVYLYQLKS